MSTKDTQTTQTTQTTDRPAKGRRITTKIAAVAIAAAAAVGVVAGAVGSSATSVSTADHAAALASQHDDLMDQWTAEAAWGADVYYRGGMENYVTRVAPESPTSPGRWTIDTSPILGDADRIPTETTLSADNGNVYAYCAPGSHLDPRIEGAISMEATQMGLGTNPWGVPELHWDTSEGDGEVVDAWRMALHLSWEDFRACLPDEQ